MGETTAKRTVEYQALVTDIYRDMNREDIISVTVQILGTDTDSTFVRISSEGTTLDSAWRRHETVKVEVVTEHRAVIGE